ncbi:MAG: C1 family peptidase, partial [Bdellovibrionales bacterium]
AKKLFDEGNWFKNSIVLLLRFGLLKEDDYHLPYKSKRDASKNKNRLLKYLERRLKIYYNDVLGLFYEHNKTRDQIQNKFEEIYNAAAIEMNEAIASSLGVVPDLTRKVDSFLLDKEINSVIVKQSLEEPKKNLVEYLFKPTQSTNKSVGPFVPTVENSFYTFKIPDQFSHRKYNINWSEDFMLARANTQMTSYPTEAFSLLIANAKAKIPTVISVSWINKFENRKLGLLSLNQKKPIKLKSDQLHLHQVLVVGVTTKIENHEEKLDFITIQNSWGEFVGQNGYYRIDAEYLKSYLFEMNWLTSKPK